MLAAEVAAWGKAALMARMLFRFLLSWCVYRRVCVVVVSLCGGLFMLRLSVASTFELTGEALWEANDTVSTWSSGQYVGSGNSASLVPFDVMVRSENPSTSSWQGTEGVNPSVHWNASGRAIDLLGMRWKPDTLLLAAAMGSSVAVRFTVPEEGFYEVDVRLEPQWVGVGYASVRWNGRPVFAEVDSAEEGTEVSAFDGVLFLGKGDSVDVVVRDGFATLAFALEQVPGMREGSVADAGAAWRLDDGNPQGSWTYGHYDGGDVTDGRNFVPFEEALVHGPTGVDMWRIPGTADPNLSLNGTDWPVEMFGIFWEPGELVLNPHNGGTAVRYTVSQSGYSHVFAAFENVQTINPPVAVALNHNERNLFEMSSLGAFGRARSFSEILWLEAGDTLDAVAGLGSASTGLRFRITPGGRPRPLTVMAVEQDRSTEYLLLTFRSRQGIRYVLEGSADLLDWQRLADWVPSQGRRTTLTFPHMIWDHPSLRFFRVGEWKP